MATDPIIKKLLDAYDFESHELEELEILVAAWRSIKMSDEKIIEQLKDYHLDITL